MDFDTELDYDEVTIAGQAYSGTPPVTNVAVSPGDTITFTPDSNIQETGWKICQCPGGTCPAIPYIWATPAPTPEYLSLNEVNNMAQTILIIVICSVVAVVGIIVGIICCCCQNNKPANNGNVQVVQMAPQQVQAMPVVVVAS